jgi:hypothetical protein
LTCPQISNGHDPAAFVTALAAGLQPYKVLPLEDPELVENMATLAVTLRGEYNLISLPFTKPECPAQPSPC